MKVVRVEVLSQGAPADVVEQLDHDLDEVVAAARGVTWPAGSNEFAINPTTGANGTPAIKSGFITTLEQGPYKREQPIFAGRYPPNSGPGPVDVATIHDGPRTVVEWETGNVSSSHRALNKMVLAFRDGLAVQGIWVVPTRAFYRYLTGRTGSYEEVAPYFPIFDRPELPGRLVVVAIEHDRLDPGVPIIEKMVYRGNVPLVGVAQTELDSLAVEDPEPA